MQLAFNRMKTTQTDDLLDYLNQHGSITPIDALRELGIFRLAARVNDLQEHGYVIPRHMVTGTAKNGRRYSVMCYERPA